MTSAWHRATELPPIIQNQLRQLLTSGEFLLRQSTKKLNESSRIVGAITIHIKYAMALQENGQKEEAETFLKEAALMTIQARQKERQASFLVQFADKAIDDAKIKLRAALMIQEEQINSETEKLVMGVINVIFTEVREETENRPIWRIPPQGGTTMQSSPPPYEEGNT